MDSIVKLLLALIIGYCFVKLFCGCSVEGMKGKKILSKIEEEGEKIEEFLKEKYNPTPTPTSNGVEVGNWISDCPAGQSPGGFMNAGCDKCPEGKYNNGNTDDKCLSCPEGSYPVDGSGNHVTSGAVGCQFCGFYNAHLTGRRKTPYEFPEDGRVITGDTQVGRGRYLDGNTCRECPPGSTLNPDVREKTVSDYSWLETKGAISTYTEWNDKPFNRRGGTNVDDCICWRGYIKVKNEEGGGWRCQKCPYASDNRVYPNKPPEQNPDKCLTRGSEECPLLTFGQDLADELSSCNDPLVCPDGYELALLPQIGDDLPECVEKKDK